jgi:hypothetical protein
VFLVSFLCTPDDVNVKLQALSGGANLSWVVKQVQGLSIGWDNPMPGELKNKWLEKMASLYWVAAST